LNTAVPLRIFLDSGVIIDGCYSQWSASKAVLILAAQTAYITIILADVVDVEVSAALLRKTLRLPIGDTRDLLGAYTTWRNKASAERWPAPTSSAITQYKNIILPVLRHANDLPPAISAIESRPDWVLSTNDAHWGLALASRTGLRVARPKMFLNYLCSARS